MASWQEKLDEATSRRVLLLKDEELENVWKIGPTYQRKLDRVANPRPMASSKEQVNDASWLRISAAASLPRGSSQEQRDGKMEELKREGRSSYLTSESDSDEMGFRRMEELMCGGRAATSSKEQQVNDATQGSALLPRDEELENMWKIRPAYHQRKLDRIANPGPLASSKEQVNDASWLRIFGEIVPYVWGATMIKQIEQVIDDIGSDDPDVARILSNQVVGRMDGGAAGLEYNAMLLKWSSVVKLNEKDHDGAKTERQNETQVLWNFYTKYMSSLRADGMHLEQRRLRESAGINTTKMGAADMKMEKIYTTLRALHYALEILVKKSPIDTLGIQILDEIRRIKGSDGCSTAARYRMDHIMPEASQEPSDLPLTLLKDITDDFSDKRVIGKGGFAVVYKGILQDGFVAVKKLSSTFDDEKFQHETIFLMSVKHKNIVRFLGFCAHTEHKVMKGKGAQKYIFPESRERLLCFEYMSKGSLSNHVTDELRGLEWDTRFQIIRGLCEGLCYLHKEKNIIHRDLKPGNVLLDDLMVPKIADFGISKFLEGVTHATTNSRNITLGYCPLEYLRFGKVSLKTDVYSLGVIIVELVTGYREDPNIKNVLRRWRYRWNKSGNCTPFAEEQIQKCIHVAMKCVAENPKQRPYIWNIVDDLNEVEPKLGHINVRNANEFTASQISPYPMEMLGIEPLEPHFPFERNKLRTCSLELTNEGVDNIAFRIDTIGPRRYHIQPNKGVVPARSKSIVFITLQEHEKAPQGTLCKDEFIVWCTSVNDGLAAKDIIEGMFHEDGGNKVDEVNLSVVFDAPPSTQL